MDVRRIRDGSIRASRQIGVDVSPTLPLLEAGLRLRGVEEVVSRILAMHATAATAYGLTREKAIAWLTGENLVVSLSEEERRFVFEARGEASRFQMQVEGMWALAWTIRIVNADLDFAKDCDSRFVMALPDLKLGEDSAKFRWKANLRPVEQVVASCDLAYCLHWAIRQSELSRKPLPAGLKVHVVVERRRALEWVLSKEPWDQVTLDT